VALVKTDVSEELKEPHDVTPQKTQFFIYMSIVDTESAPDYQYLNQ
jgi:hypothetical protein